MPLSFKEIVQECSAGSDAERVSFPEVVGKLMAAGVERYHADLVRGEKTYYLPGGDSAVTSSHGLSEAPAMAFSGAGVDAAVRAIQKRDIGYREFCRRVAEAGCVGYIVTLAGRRAVYYGRTGETHVEMFPQPR